MLVVKVLLLFIIVIRNVTHAINVMLIKEIRKRLRVVIVMVIVMHMPILLELPIAILLVMSSLVRISLRSLILEPVFIFVEM